MFYHIYTCPKCGSSMGLISCPFSDQPNQLMGQCEHCNLRIDILEEDYQEWVRRKEAKQDEANNK